MPNILFEYDNSIILTAYYFDVRIVCLNIFRYKHVDGKKSLLFEFMSRFEQS